MGRWGCRAPGIFGRVPHWHLLRVGSAVSETGMKGDLRVLAVLLEGHEVPLGEMRK